MVEQEVAFLQMLEPAELRPAQPVACLTLVRVRDPVGRDADVLRDLHDEIARPHHWSSLAWSNDRWRRWLTTQEQHHWFIVLDEARIGWACLQRHGDEEVEIDNFGLVPAAIGRGYGGAALTMLVQTAWGLVTEGETEPGERCTRGRLWLRTSSFDHPNAVANYKARGFQEYRREIRHRELEPDSTDEGPM